MRHYKTYLVSFVGTADDVMADIQRALGEDAIHSLGTDRRTSAGTINRVIKLSVYVDSYYLKNDPPKNPALYEDAEWLTDALQEVDGYTSISQTYGA